MSEGLELLCDDCHGRYIPQLMARRLYQDNDLWAYCDELMTDEEKENFFGEY